MLLNRLLPVLISWKFEQQVSLFIEGSFPSPKNLSLSFSLSPSLSCLFSLFSRFTKVEKTERLNPRVMVLISFPYYPIMFSFRGQEAISVFITHPFLFILIIFCYVAGLLKTGHEYNKLIDL